MVSADGTGLVSQAGAVLVVQALQVTGLDRGLRDALGRWRARRAVHDPGKIIADLAMAVVLGGDCLADRSRLRQRLTLTSGLKSGIGKPTHPACVFSPPVAYVDTSGD